MWRNANRSFFVPKGGDSKGSNTRGATSADEETGDGSLGRQISLDSKIVVRLVSELEQLLNFLENDDFKSAQRAAKILRAGHSRTVFTGQFQCGFFLFFLRFSAFSSPFLFQTIFRKFTGARIYYLLGMRDQVPYVILFKVLFKSTASCTIIRRLVKI